MQRKIAQFFTLLLMGIQTGVSYAHFMQAPGKLQLPPDVYIWVQNVVIVYKLKLGVVEVGTYIAALAALYLVRKNKPAFAATVVGVVCVFAMLAVWAMFIEPINQQVDTWTPANLPANWMQLREQWHFMHYIRLILAVIGMSAFTLSVLISSEDSKLWTRQKSL